KRMNEVIRGKDFYMNSDYIFEEFLRYNQDCIKKVKKQLSRCPRGTLYEQKKGNKSYFVQADYENGQAIRVGISSKPELVRALIKKYLLEAELDCREKKQAAVLEMERRWPEFDLTLTASGLKGRCPSITDDMISAAVKEGEATGWATEPFEQCSFRPEERRQITSRGLKVRSKSEMFIAEKLYDYGLEFRYEEVFHAGNMQLVPDFTIRRADGKIFIWEHQGLTSVQTYIERQTKKAQLYASIGYVPWDNLIVTYDNSDGIIDLRIVESEIKNKLLI
ncbi:MAG: hypothetical protein Q4E99_03215, partial [Bacillota bacterium]|nr:hypothetical protein [Bacillota bacterium]